MDLAEMIGDPIRLQISKPEYFRMIEAAGGGGSPRFASFAWSGWAGLGLISMIYDESDELLLDESKRSQAWKQRMKNTELGCAFMAHHMEGHFYKVHYQC